jgi:hypothetical protein
MDRYDGATASATPDALPAAGTPGHFSSGVPGTKPRTVLEGWYMDLLVEEIRNVILAAGITPNRAVQTQLRDAINTLSGNNALLKANNLSDLASLPAALANLGFTGSLGTSGYAVIPLSIGGVVRNLIIQWGRVLASSPEGQYTFAFPTAFPNACLAIIPTVINNTLSSSDDVWAQWDQAHTSTTTGAIYIQWDGQPSNQSDGYAHISIGW